MALLQFRHWCSCTWLWWWLSNEEIDAPQVLCNWFQIKKWYIDQWFVELDNQSEYFIIKKCVVKYCTDSSKKHWYVPEQEEFMANFNVMWRKTTPHESFNHSIPSLKMINWRGLALNISTTAYNGHVARISVQKYRKKEIALESETKFSYVERKLMESLMIVSNRPIDEYQNY